MNCDPQLLGHIKSEFFAMWDCRTRGRSIEVISPLLTISNKYVSVFVTTRNNEFIVADGGYIHSGEYDVTPDVQDDIFATALGQIEDAFQINTTYNNLEKPVYFKKTPDIDMLGSIVHDVVHFIQAVVNAAAIDYSSEEEKKEKETFRKEANDYLATLLRKDDYKLGQYLYPEMKSIRFNAIITKKSRISLIKYVSGASLFDFTSSISRANMYFEMADQSLASNIIDNKIALVNDVATGYNEGVLKSQLDHLGRLTRTTSILWKDRSNLREIIHSI